LLFNLALGTSKKLRKDWTGLELNETHQLLVYVDDVNMFGVNVNTTNKTT